MRARYKKLTGLLLAVVIHVAAPVLPASAADLTARESGVPLFARQDIESEPLGRLTQGEALFPMAESVSQETWYMVRTKQGQVGWVRAADIVVTNQVKQAFREKDTGSSFWAAITGDGKKFSGAWSVAANSTARSARGFWTLRDGEGNTSARGAWTAEMHATGWNGTWRAKAENGQGESTGSWSAEFPQTRNVRFADLFEAAAKEAIRGLWTGGSASGNWSIQTFK